MNEGVVTLGNAIGKLYHLIVQQRAIGQVQAADGDAARFHGQ